MKTCNELVIVVWICVLAGCGRGAPASAASYEMAKSLYSICNLQREGMLETMSVMTDEAAEKKEISTAEYERLKAIIDYAMKGDWDQGMELSRKMMEREIR